MTIDLDRAFALRTGTFTVGAVTVAIREPSAADVSWALKTTDLFAACLAVRCLQNPDGNRLYKDEDAERLHDTWSHDRLEQLAKAIRALSNDDENKGDGEGDDTEDPSDQAGGDTSPSASPSH